MSGAAHLALAREFAVLAVRKAWTGGLAANRNGLERRAQMIAAGDFDEAPEVQSALLAIEAAVAADRSRDHG